MDPIRPIVEMRGIAKTFGSTRALRGVDFTLKEGEIHALLGRNGAGKSTFVSAMSGVTPADAGHTRIAATAFEADGSDYAARIRSDIAVAGVSGAASLAVTCLDQASASFAWLEGRNIAEGGRAHFIDALTHAVGLPVEVEFSCSINTSSANKMQNVFSLAG